MNIVSSRVVSLAVVGLLVVAGCRTYENDKYDPGPKTYQALQETVQQMEQELGRAQSDLRRLEAAAETRDTLRTLATRYRSYVQSHEAVLEGHREQAERLSADAAYRTVHRAYGALVTDRRLLQKQYRRTVRAVWATVRDTTIPRKPARDPSRYVITPVQFPRVGGRGPLTMAEALRPLEGTPGLQREEVEGSE
jgi:outer membrane murein-binding lipoprotein Lpp